MSSKSPQNDSSSPTGTSEPNPAESPPKTPLETATQASSTCSEPAVIYKTTAPLLTTPPMPEESQQEVSILDVHAITDTILAASSCLKRKKRRRPTNDAKLLVDCLNERFPNSPRLFVSLEDEIMEEETSSILENVVYLPWQSPGRAAGSETPTLKTALEICYCLSAWLHSDPKRIMSNISIRSKSYNLNNAPIVIVMCHNGKTRTGLAVACLLKFLQRVDSVRDGFCHFLERRCCCSGSPESILQKLPPSLHTFFRNFDNLLEFRTHLNRKPLLLKAVAIQGVPVEDAPCLDIWDGTGNHLYSSHPDLYLDVETAADFHPSQWAEDEGFYRINCLLAGDFCILCKFGGPYADASIDGSKILFRYTNSTGFMGSASPYELPVSRVDLQRQYAEYFDPNDFLLTLVLDAHWNNTEVPSTDVSTSILPEIKQGVEAVEAGWHLITKYHIVQPQESDVDRLIAESLGELEGCPKHIVSLALQLANRDSTMTQTILLEGRLRSWWQTSDDLSSVAEPELPTLDRSVLETMGEGLNADEALQKIQSLLEAVDPVKRIKTCAPSSGEPSDHATSPTTAEASGAQTVAQSGIQYMSPIMRPHPGDVRSTLNSSRVTSLLRNRQTSFMGDHPVFPLVPHRKNRGTPAPIDDPENDAAVELLLQLLHPGVCLQDLLDVAKYMEEIKEPLTETAITSMTSIEGRSDDSKEDGILHETQLQAEFVKESVDTATEAQTAVLVQPNQDALKDVLVSIAAAASAAIANRQNDTISKNEPISIAGAAAASAISNRQSQDDSTPRGVAMVAAAAAISKRANPGLGGAAAAAAAAAIEKRQAAGDSSASGPVAALEKRATCNQGIGGAAAAAAAAAAIAKRQASVNMNASSPGIGGAAAAAAAAAMAKRQALVDVKALSPGIGGAVAAAAAAAMAKRQAAMDTKASDSGIGGAAAVAAIGKRNSQDAPDSCEAVPVDVSNDEIALKEDPRFIKYFKMLKMGLPEGAVRNALQRDEVDGSILELDPDKSYASQVAVAKNDDDLPLGDDAKYQKYFKMLKMGLPDGAVRNAMQRDGVDDSVLDLDPTKSLKSQTNETKDSDGGVPIKDDPAFQKYFKMRKMGLPDGAIRNAMQRDGVDSSVLDLDPEKSLKSQTTGSAPMDDGIPIKDDPAFQKYFKMMKMGLPLGAVHNAMERDGVDSSILDLDHDKSLQSQRSNPAEDDGVPLKEDPEWSKYFKMLKMGLPMGAVKNAVERDGKDPSVLDLDHSKSIASQMRASAKPQQQKKKKRVRRKKIFWNPLDSKQIKADSLWSNVKGRIQMSQLKYDPKEFADLFTESADPADKNKKKDQKDAKKVKKAVQVIDGKRSMNGGIILARLKLDYKKIADMVDQMKIGNLDSTSVKALKEMLPTSEEKSGLINYMKKCGSSEEAQGRGYADLSECEKYMYTMLDVPDAAAKYDCMLFRSQFKGRFDELLESIEKIEHACDEVRTSEKLQAIMAIILTLVNEINTGGEGKTAAGFTLDALLKLGEAKAFDKKTSVLNYLVKLVKSNDPTLLSVRSDLKRVKEAELVILDTLCADIQELKNEIEPITATIKAQAEELEKEGKLTQMTLKELTEQRTSIRNLASVPQYNQVDHHTGRTPMERFILNAEASIKDAIALSDVVKGKFQKLLEYFGESNNKASNEFFGILNRFLTELDTAIQQVEREEKAKKREEDKCARANKKKHGGTTGSKAEGPKKSQTATKDSSGDTVMAVAAGAIAEAGQHRNGEKPVPGSGIAAMAAAAAAKKKTQPVDTPTGKSAPVLGIPAMAAAAAKRNSQQSGSPENEAVAAAMAATVAAKMKSQSVDSTENIMPTEKVGPGVGIAAMAAAAAAKKKSQQNKAGTDNTAPVSGITAMAAAVAAKKKPNVDNSTNAGLSIAAMAAAVAVKKADKQALSTDTTSVSGVAHAAAAKKRSGIESAARSGMAAMVAQAAENKSAVSSDPKESPENIGVSNNVALAAAATKKSDAGTVPHTDDSSMDRNGDSSGVSNPQLSWILEVGEETTAERTPEGRNESKEQDENSPTKGLGESGSVIVEAAAAEHTDSVLTKEENETKEHGPSGVTAEATTATVNRDTVFSQNGSDDPLKGDQRPPVYSLLEEIDFVSEGPVCSPETESKAIYRLPKQREQATVKWLATLKESIDSAVFETQEGTSDEDFDVRMNTAPKKNRQTEWLAAVSDAIKNPPT